MKEVAFKAKKGKTIKVSYALCNGKITFIKITGDFFFYPEDKLLSIERGLIGSSESQSKAFLLEFFNENKIKIIGIKKSDIKNLIGSIFKNEMETNNR